MESADTVIAELAEKWSWQDNYRNLVFFLRKNVKWHDGKPFTSKDVKYTFDVVREAPDAAGKLRLNPRKDWYANVEAIEAPEPHTVVFRLKRPQPSLLLMLASGYSPVLPAHVPLNELRQRAWAPARSSSRSTRAGEFVELERNPDYFVPGRPYLDGIRYLDHHASAAPGWPRCRRAGSTSRAARDDEDHGRHAQAGGAVARGHRDRAERQRQRAHQPQAPPFDNLRCAGRSACAMDRRAYVQGVRHDGAVVGAALMPQPLGLLGRCPSRSCRRLPGYRRPGRRQGRGQQAARRGRRTAPGKPLRSR